MATATAEPPSRVDADAAERAQLLAELEAVPDFFRAPELEEQEATDTETDEADATPEERKDAADKQSDAEKVETKPAEDAAKGQPPEDRAKAELEEIKAERARLAKEREEIEQARNAPKSKEGYTAEDYEAVAKQFDEQGNDELARQARQKAQTMRQDAVMGSLKAAHAKALRDAVAKYPDLNKPESALYKRLDATLKSRPALFSYPEGIADAVEACVAIERATRVEALEKEVGELKQALAKKEKLLHPTPGGPSEPAGEGDDFDNMTPEQQRKAIERELRAMEASGQSMFQQ